MDFIFKSENKASHLIEIFENIQLLLKISPPQIKYKIIDESNGLFQQTIFVKSIKKKFEFQVIHKKISKNSFLSKIVSGPFKNTETKIIILENDDKSQINVEIKLKMSLPYKIFSLILSKKIQTANIALFNRLEKFVEFYNNNKHQISFDENYETLIIELKNEKFFF